MFIISVKSDKLKKIFAFSVAAFMLGLGAVIYIFSAPTLPAAKIGEKSMKAETNDDRIAFFSQFALEAGTEPLEIKEVLIPAEFDETYTEYNGLQKEQGLDLENYKGVRAKFYSYEILNYPGYEYSDGTIRGNLLTYNGIVIGGDISNIELDGFMKPFDCLTKEAEEVTKSSQ